MKLTRRTCRQIMISLTMQHLQTISSIGCHFFGVSWWNQSREGPPVSCIGVFPYISIVHSCLQRKFLHTFQKLVNILVLHLLIYSKLTSVGVGGRKDETIRSRWLLSSKCPVVFPEQNGCKHTYHRLLGQIGQAIGIGFIWIQLVGLAEGQGNRHVTFCCLWVCYDFIIYITPK